MKKYSGIYSSFSKLFFQKNIVSLFVVGLLIVGAAASLTLVSLNNDVRQQAVYSGCNAPAITIPGGVDAGACKCPNGQVIDPGASCPTSPSPTKIATGPTSAPTNTPAPSTCIQSGEFCGPGSPNGGKCCFGGTCYNNTCQTCVQDGQTVGQGATCCSGKSYPSGNIVRCGSQPLSTSTCTGSCIATSLTCSEQGRLPASGSCGGTNIQCCGASKFVASPTPYQYCTIGEKHCQNDQTVLFCSDGTKYLSLPCSSGLVCQGGACVRPAPTATVFTKLANGAICSDNSQCISGNCADAGYGGYKTCQSSHTIVCQGRSLNNPVDATYALGARMTGTDGLCYTCQSTGISGTFVVDGTGRACDGILHPTAKPSATPTAKPTTAVTDADCSASLSQFVCQAHTGCTWANNSCRAQTAAEIAAANTNACTFSEALTCNGKPCSKNVLGQVVCDTTAFAPTCGGQCVDLYGGSACPGGGAPISGNCSGLQSCCPAAAVSACTPEQKALNTPEAVCKQVADLGKNNATITNNSSTLTPGEQALAPIGDAYYNILKALYGEQQAKDYLTSVVNGGSAYDPFGSYVSSCVGGTDLDCLGHSAVLGGGSVAVAGGAVYAGPVVATKVAPYVAPVVPFVQNIVDKGNEILTNLGVRFFNSGAGQTVANASAQLHNTPEGQLNLAIAEAAGIPVSSVTSVASQFNQPGKVIYVVAGEEGLYAAAESYGKSIGATTTTTDLDTALSNLGKGGELIQVGHGNVQRITVDGQGRYLASDYAQKVAVRADELGVDLSGCTFGFLQCKSGVSGYVGNTVIGANEYDNSLIVDAAAPSFAQRFGQVLTDLGVEGVQTYGVNGYVNFDLRTAEAPQLNVIQIGPYNSTQSEIVHYTQ